MKIALICVALAILLVAQASRCTEESQLFIQTCQMGGLIEDLIDQGNDDVWLAACTKASAHYKACLEHVKSKAVWMQFGKRFYEAQRAKNQAFDVGRRDAFPPLRELNE